MNLISCRGSWKHCGMDHVLAAVSAVYAKWVRSHGNSNCCCGCMSVALWQKWLVSHGSRSYSRQSRSWPQHWSLLGLSCLALAWHWKLDSPGLPHATRGFEGLEILTMCAFSLSDQYDLLYRSAHENPSGLCFVLGYQMGLCLYLCLWCMYPCLYVCANVHAHVCIL